MVDVSAAVEVEQWEESDLGGGVGCGGVSVAGVVEGLDVRGMVAGVVKSHDLRGYVGLESVVGVCVSNG